MHSTVEMQFIITTRGVKSQETNCEVTQLAAKSPSGIKPRIKLSTLPINFNIASKA